MKQYTDSMCGQTITVTANGKTAQATIMDLVSGLGVQAQHHIVKLISCLPYFRSALPEEEIATMEIWT